MSSALSGPWSVFEVASITIPDGANLSLEFGEGSVGGHAGCNALSARIDLSGSDLRFGPVRTTKKACGQQIMAVEIGFLRAMQRVSRYEISCDGTLTLYGFDTVMMRARRG